MRAISAEDGLDFLSDQSIVLYYQKKDSKNSYFFGLAHTFQGQKHGRKEFEIPFVHKSHFF